MTNIKFHRRRRMGGALRGVIATAAVLTAVACDTKEVLEITDPDVAKPGVLDDPTALPAVHAGALGDFTVAYVGDTGEGSTSGMILVTGLLGDEFISSDTFNDRNNVDFRSTREDDGVLVALMRRNQRARASADFASNKFAKFVPNDLRRAETMSLAGYMITMMAEAFCSGVPLSKVEESGELVYGPGRSTAELWDDAVAKFDSALAIATGTSAAAVTQQNLAKIGKGRALLNKGNKAAAAAAVAGVPNAFSYILGHSENSGRENNGVWVFQRIGRRVAVSDREGTNGLPYRLDADARVPVVLGAPAVGFDNLTSSWWQNKYPLRASPTALASGAEARLIEAEAALPSNVTGFIDALNAARAVAGLPAATAAATDPARIDQLFKERAYALWLTSHRLGDMRRLIRQYGRTAESVFPTGPWHKGGVYGTDVNLIMPLVERNNPNFSGCIDRNA